MAPLKWTLGFLIFFVMALASNDAMDRFGVEKGLWHYVGSGVAGGIAAFLAGKLGLLPVARKGRG